MIYVTVACISSHAKPPNILFIYVDDLGYEALGSYGGLDFSTPNLDQMAADGVRFSRAYASGVCTPSRVSMHTSLYAARHGHRRVLPVHTGSNKIVDFKKMPTYAQLMRKKGYRTAVTGKWQLAGLEAHPEHPRDSGFDSWCLWQIWRTDPKTGEGFKTTRYWEPCFNMDGKIREDIADCFGPDVLVDYVIQNMKEATEANEPFLIVHNELLPHYPMIQTPDDKAASPPRKASLVNMVNYMDKLVKKLLVAVEDLGIRDNTYVVFMADNGTEESYFINPGAGQEGERAHTRHTKEGKVNGGKHTVTDGGTHVPMIWWGANAIPRGAVCNDLVDIVDIFPTFCELGKVPIPESVSINGHSILPQVQGREGKSHAYTHGAAHKKEAVFDGQWRLKKTGVLIDARSLPMEPLADESDPEAKAARARLQKILNGIQLGQQEPGSFK
ncbi:N-acetylgalactosamine-6-sulfatase [bacterium E08(2017)]|nr:N-acetylgalactosamine-6-sulfatase [bacterium E08(2017)]